MHAILVGREDNGATSRPQEPRIQALWSLWVWLFAFGRKRSKPSSCCLVRRIEHAVIGPTYAHHGLRLLLDHLHAAAVEASAVLVDYRAE